MAPSRICSEPSGRRDHRPLRGPPSRASTDGVGTLGTPESQLFNELGGLRNPLEITTSLRDSRPAG